MDGGPLWFECVQEAEVCCCCSQRLVVQQIGSSSCYSGSGGMPTADTNRSGGTQNVGAVLFLVLITRRVGTLIYTGCGWQQTQHFELIFSGRCCVIGPACCCT